MKRIVLIIAFFSMLSCSDDFEKDEKTNRSDRMASENLYEITVDSTWNGLNFTQGACTSVQASNNLELLEHFIEVADSPDYDGLSIVGDFDCFFKVGMESNPPTSYYDFAQDGINLKDNFTFQMSNNTHLRVFQTDLHHQLIGVFEKSNVNIIGGHLHGERLLSHAGPQIMFGNLLYIRGGHNINVTSTSFYECNGDGIQISASVYFNNTTNSYLGGMGSENINIDSCYFKENRRAGINIVDLNNSLITRCNFVDNGKDMGNPDNPNYNSYGRWPSSAINVEGDRYRDPLDNLIKYNFHPQNVIIRDNTESGSKTASFLVSPADNITIENNNVQNGISLGFADHCTVRNNSIVSPTYLGVGISLGPGPQPNPLGPNYPPVDPNPESIHHNIITSNHIENFIKGIDLYNSHDNEISVNEILQCEVGVNMQKNLQNYSISGNRIISDKVNSKGFTAIQPNYLDNVNIKMNTVLLTGVSSLYPFSLHNINKAVGQENFKVIIDGNNTQSTAMSIISNSKGSLQIVNNWFLNGLSVGSCIFTSQEPLKISNNTMKPPSNQHGIILENSSYVVITENNIELGIINLDNRCILASPGNNYIEISSNFLTDPSEDVQRATIYLGNTKNSIIRQNTGNIGTLQDSRYFVRGLSALAGNNVYQDNYATIYPYTRNNFLN